MSPRGLRIWARELCPWGVRKTCKQNLTFSPLWTFLLISIHFFNFIFVLSPALFKFSVYCPWEIAPILLVSTSISMPLMKNDLSWTMFPRRLGYRFVCICTSCSSLLDIPQDPQTQKFIAKFILFLSTSSPVLLRSTSSLERLTLVTQIRNFRVTCPLSSPSIILVT